MNTKLCDLCENNIPVDTLESKARFKMKGSNILIEVCEDCSEVISMHLKEGIKICRNKNKNVQDFKQTYKKEIKDNRNKLF